MNCGADLAKLVPGRVSTEVDSRLAYDTHGIIHKVLILLLFCVFLWKYKLQTGEGEFELKVTSPQS